MFSWNQRQAFGDHLKFGVRGTSPLDCLSRRQASQRVSVAGEGNVARRFAYDKKGDIAHMTYNDDNIFAKILRGEMPAHKVYEDEGVFAFLDIMPRSKGHCLVIPKKPAINMMDVEPDDLCVLIRGVHKLAPIVCEAMGADGFVIQQFNEAAAGQMVFHIHFHIVPRYLDVPLKHAANIMEQDGILSSNAGKIRALIVERRI